MDSQDPDPLRVIALIKRLQQRFGSQEFGQIVQTLVALSFREVGFEVLKNTIGVPDLIASRPASSVGFAIEVKTGEEKIGLSPRDLKGVLSSGRTPVVVALFLSDPGLHWLTKDARALRPASYRRFEVEAKPSVNLGFDLTEVFNRILVKNYLVSMEGPGPLARLLVAT